MIELRPIEINDIVKIKNDDNEYVIIDINYMRKKVLLGSAEYIFVEFNGDEIVERLGHKKEKRTEKKKRTEKVKIRLKDPCCDPLNPNWKEYDAEIIREE